MAYDFRFPDVGQGITEGEIVKWHVKEGDSVREDQVIAEIETDKAVVEVPSPKAGTIIKRFTGGEGSRIKVGETLVVIGEKGEKLAATAAVNNKKMQKREKDAGAVVGKLPDSIEDSAVMVLPSARELAKKLDVGLSSVKGTGPGGRITIDDVKAASASPAAIKPQQEAKQSGMKVTKKYDFWGFVRRYPLKGIRRVTAEKMVQANTRSAMATSMDEADVTKLAAVREKEKPAAEKKGIKLTLLPYIIKAVVQVLKKHPYFNSSIDESTDEIVVKDYYNIGFAVATDAGLFVPVIKGADMKSIYDIAREAKELSDKARSRKIDLADIQGGSFTVSNVGSLGSTAFFTPLLNFPESAILGVGRMAEKPVAVNGKVEIRKMLPLSLTYDHRVVDGADAAEFLATLIGCLENPDLLVKG